MPIDDLTRHLCPPSKTKFYSQNSKYLQVGTVQYTEGGSSRDPDLFNSWFNVSRGSQFLIRIIHNIESRPLWFNGRIRCPILGGPVLELENLEFIT
jgi:hypothetical protein